MPSYKGVSCDLYIDGSKAPEYDMTTDDRTCTVWVMAQEDKEFGFEIDVSGTSDNNHRLQFIADGQKLVSRVLMDGRIKTSEYCAEFRDENGAWMSRKMMFRKADLVEDDKEQTEDRTAIIDAVGSLQWNVWRVRSFKLYHGQPTVRKPFQAASSLKEKDIKGKAISHYTQLGDLVEQPTATSYKSELKDPKDSPYVVFIFKYASKAILQSKGYIPRSPSPERLDNDVESMSGLEMQQEIMRLRAEVKATRKRKIKEEHLEETGPEVIDLVDSPKKKGRKL
ncbi:hypothetical protein TWF696_004568 [Orbilia brochopaga]|uniref:DUF7918 domain-containing protein n=1 Tax=Orbilia brochopaga TaxID=3140254 RepID=A0AAV9VD06_9PEZI